MRAAFVRITGNNHLLLFVHTERGAHGAVQHACVEQSSCPEVHRHTTGRI